MNQREALLQAVCDNPDDDIPRLVFADWLEERGEPERAEFVRVQIEAAKLTPGDVRLVRRARELEALLGSQWVRELPVPDSEHVNWVTSSGGWRGDEPCGVGGATFDRGFACRLWVKTAGTLVAQANQLFRATPVRRLMVHHVMKANKLARLSQLQHLHTFRVRILSRQAADELTECSYLDAVPDVRLSLRALPEEHVARLRKRFGNRLQDQP